jgi:cytochrome c-type biogenesis protein CcmH/NrfG
MFFLTPVCAETTLALVFGPVAACMKNRRSLRFARILLLVVLPGLFPSSARSQDSSGEGMMTRGSRAEIAVTVRDGAGNVVTSSATIKLYRDGFGIDQSTTTKGRAFFIAPHEGDYSVTVEAAGYKSAQKDVTVSAPIKQEVDVYLQRNAGPNEVEGVPGGPVLAPKAKEELVKGLKALADNKLDEAQKHESEALKLAPSNPEVLYVQGVIYLKRSDPRRAQTELEKSDQLEPNQARVLAALGMALCNQKKYQEAIPTLEKALRLDPNAGWETQWALAKSYYYVGQYDQGLQLAQQARSAAHGTVPQTELLLAQCLTAVGRYEDSAEVLRAFLKSNASGPDASTAQRWLDGLIANGKIHPAAPSP